MSQSTKYGTSEKGNSSASGRSPKLGSILDVRSPTQRREEGM